MLTTYNKSLLHSSHGVVARNTVVIGTCMERSEMFDRQIHVLT